MPLQPAGVSLIKETDVVKAKAAKNGARTGAGPCDAGAAKRALAVAGIGNSLRIERGRVKRSLAFYSALNACSTSTREARAAGTSDAVRAAATSTAAATDAGRTSSVCTLAVSRPAMRAST
jgi:hypothetical protein